MPSYSAPVDDIKFLLHEFLQMDQNQTIPGYSDLTPDVTHGIFEGAAKLCQDVLQPLNQSGDVQGCRLENGVVRTPDGFPEAWKQFNEGGWGGLSGAEARGGAGLPAVVDFQFMELAASANLSLALTSALTTGAQRVIDAIGEDWMLEHVVPKMVSGEWSGTMNLTEPHCGTDLKLMHTNATDNGDGTWAINGTKIFISAGDQDYTDNIMHLVIAKVPGPDGKLRDNLADVHLFLVPKYMVDPETGAMGVRNGVGPGNIEKKMGLKASPTCVMNFDNAVGYKLKSVGTGSGAGMGGMFMMMNGARLGTGIQGLGQAEVALQNAKTYCQERLAGRALTGAKYPDQRADPIIVYPDVRRLLLQTEAFTQGARALNMWVSQLLDEIERCGDETQKQEADDLAKLLTPIIKAYGTDKAYEATNACLQVFGGHGYIHEHGMEQFVRDARILQLYEGANGVQALDLVARKMTSAGGRPTMLLFSKINAFIKENDSDDMAPYIGPLKDGLARLQDGATWLMTNAQSNYDNAGSASYELMNIMGTVVLQWMWARMAKVSLAALGAGQGNADFYRKKLLLARIWGEREIPNTLASIAKIKAGSEAIMELDDAAFA